MQHQYLPSCYEINTSEIAGSQVTDCKLSVITIVPPHHLRMHTYNMGLLGAVLFTKYGIQR